MSLLKNTSTILIDSESSLIEALNEIRLFRAIGEERDITIKLSSDIFITKTINIDVENVTIDGSGFRIIGGVKVENWQNDLFNGVKCQSAKLPENIQYFTDFWVDGKRASSPRYPKESYLEILDCEVNNTTNFYDSSNWIIAKTSDLNHIENIEDGIINYYHFWVDEHSPIKSYNPISGKLEMLYPSRFRITTKDGDFGRIRYYLSHIPSTFGAENEWYLDKKSKKIYYVGSVNEAIAPTVAQVFEISANNCNIFNVEIFCTRGDYVSTAISPRQNITTELGFASDIQSVCSAPGAVIYKNVSNCAFKGCSLHGIGIHGIEIKRGCNGIKIENNRIYDIGAGGIKIAGGEFGCDESEKTTHCTIKNNEISNCGKRYEAGCGILGMHTSNLEILDNHIHHIDYSGISVGWVWGYNESNSYNNSIKGNHIHDIGFGMLSDLGGIYLLGPQAGSIVSENRIHDISCATYAGIGIYTDEGTSDVIIENNVVFNAKSTAFSQHFGKNNIVRNNIFAFADEGIANITRIEDHTTVIFENNICLTNNAPSYKKGKDGGICTIKSNKNLFWDINGNCQPTVDNSLEEWQKKGKDTDSIIADPMFIDYKNYNFTISENSPAVKLGFKPIIGFPATDK